MPVHSTELDSCQSSGAQHFELAPTLMQNLCIAVLTPKYYVSCINYEVNLRTHVTFRKFFLLLRKVLVFVCLLVLNWMSLVRTPYLPVPLSCCGFFSTRLRKLLFCGQNTRYEVPILQLHFTLGVSTRFLRKILNNNSPLTTIQNCILVPNTTTYTFIIN